jgi:hypothetical protein
MFYFVDESGNTGLELFDPNQPMLYYGVLGAQTNLDITGESLLRELRQTLGVKRIHANELGVARLTTIAARLTRFNKKNDLRFSLLKVTKQDHAIFCFFDQVFLDLRVDPLSIPSCSCKLETMTLRDRRHMHPLARKEVPWFL